MFKFKLSWFGFVLFNSILITLLNFNLHSFVYEKLSQNLLLTLVFIVAYFGLVHMIFSLIFVKYLTKYCLYFLFYHPVPVFILSLFMEF